MENVARDDVVRELTTVIASEMEAQLGVERPFSDIPYLIADAVIDHFDVRRKAIRPDAAER